MASLPVISDQPLKGRAERYSFARACGYGIWEASRRAGADPETGQGSKWEARSDVQKRIHFWRTFKETDEMLAEERALIKRELQLIGTANMDDFVTLIPSPSDMERINALPEHERAAAMADVSYLPVLDLSRVNAMPPMERRAAMASVKTIKYTENGPTFEMHSKADALSQWRDMQGFKASTKTELTGGGGAPLLQGVDRDTVALLLEELTVARIQRVESASTSNQKEI